ncbi:2-O-methyltransferase NoeI [mine drainage metagenome]|uniref:2-O-methyltransferase NoeI n=1 Tax=mine drainage metagenome TaxID=410659 RepID=A0A1J5SCP9_9ZZZZ
MKKILTNIINGILKRLFLKKQQQSTFELISWWTEKILKHEDDSVIKQRKFKSFVINYIRPYELLHTYREIFEKEIYRFNSNKTSPLIIDCGANIGLSVLYFKNIFPNAKVICFEPDNNNFRLLEKNIADNNLNDIGIRKEAVWIQNGFISFESKGSEASKINESGEDSLSQIPCIDFMEVLKNHAEIDFLKMDIEGAEHSVIKHCSAHLHKIKNMFIEYHGKVSETNKLIELLTIFHENHFQVYIKNAADNLSMPFIQKESGHWADVQLNIFCYKND